MKNTKMLKISMKSTSQKNLQNNYENKKKEKI